MFIKEDELDRIRFSIAIDRSTGLLTDATKTLSGKECNCYCFFCNENLVAINKAQNKQRPHFRHLINKKCIATYETFIHWLAKEIFKKIKKIKLPAITVNDLINIDETLRAEIQKHITLNSFDGFLYDAGDLVLQESQYIEIEDVSFEKKFGCQGQSIIVDIAILKNNEYFLIEPYFTNPINEQKLDILKLLDNSVMSINLKEFRSYPDVYFTLDEFENFIQDKIISKKWVLLRKSKIRMLETICFDRIESKLNEAIQYFTEIKEIESQQKDIVKQLHDIKFQENKLKNQLEFNKDHIGKIFRDIKNKTSLRFNNLDDD